MPRVDTVDQRMDVLGFERLGPPHAHLPHHRPDTGNRSSTAIAQVQLDHVYASRGFHTGVTVTALNSVEEWGVGGGMGRKRPLPSRDRGRGGKPLKVLGFHSVGWPVDKVSAVDLAKCRLGPQSAWVHPASWLSSPRPGTDTSGPTGSRSFLSPPSAPDLIRLLKQETTCRGGHPGKRAQAGQLSAAS